MKCMAAHVPAINEPGLQSPSRDQGTKLTQAKSDHLEPAIVGLPYTPPVMEVNFI